MADGGHPSWENLMLEKQIPERAVFGAPMDANIFISISAAL